MENKLRLERLTELKFLLDNYSEFFKEEKTKFDMETWFVGKPQHGCATAACALGAACLYPPFNKQGLKLDALALVSGRVSYSPSFRVGDSRFGGYFAAIHFFGISSHQAHYLFHPSNYPWSWGVTPKDVAERVGELIKAYKKSGEEA